MQQFFEPIESNTQIYKKIMSQIQDMIFAGQLKKGDRLPPERQLADMLHVGRSALKQALSALEALGIVTSRHGDGNYITSDNMAVFNPLALHFYLDNGEENDILEFRFIMEIQLASLAAMKITDQQAESFALLVEKMKNAKSIDDRLHYNNLFHFRIVDICNNLIIKTIYADIMGLIAEQIRQTDGYLFYESHRLIFEAIRNHQPVEAANAMADHFQRKFPNYEYYKELFQGKNTR